MCVVNGDKYYMDLNDYNFFETIFKNIWELLAPVSLMVPAQENFMFDSEDEPIMEITNEFNEVETFIDSTNYNNFIIWDHSLMEAKNIHNLTYEMTLSPNTKVGLYSSDDEINSTLTYFDGIESNVLDYTPLSFEYGVSKGSISINGLPYNARTNPTLKNELIITGISNNDIQDKFIVENIDQVVTVNNVEYTLTSIDYKVQNVAGETKDNLDLYCADNADNTKSCMIESYDLGAGNYTFNLNYSTKNIEEVNVEKVYDGKVRQVDNIFIKQQFNLSPNAKIELITNNQLTADVIRVGENIGYQELRYEIDDNGRSFIGVLKLVINPRPINISVGTLEKIYDGEPLSFDKIIYNYQNLTTNTGLINTHIINGDINAEITNVGNVKNEVENLVITQNSSTGVNVTNNYDITLSNGRLTVYDNSVSLDSINKESDIPKFIAVGEDVFINPEYPYDLDNGSYLFDFVNDDNEEVIATININDGKINISYNTWSLLSVIVILLSIALLIYAIIKKPVTTLYRYNEKKDDFDKKINGNYLYDDINYEYIKVEKNKLKKIRDKNMFVQNIVYITALLTLLNILIFVALNNFVSSLAIADINSLFCILILLLQGGIYYLFFVRNK